VRLDHLLSKEFSLGAPGRERGPGTRIPRCKIRVWGWGARWRRHWQSHVAGNGPVPVVPPVGVLSPGGGEVGAGCGWWVAWKTPCWVLRKQPRRVISSVAGRAGLVVGFSGKDGPLTRPANYTTVVVYATVVWVLVGVGWLGCVC
jgi:hypothetical protein